MNVKEYIESGILEEYVFGTLTKEEFDQVHQLSKQYPLIASEIAVIEETIIQLAAAHATPPPVNLLDNILKEIKEEEDVVNPNNLAPKSLGQPKTIKKLRLYKMLLAACFIGLVCSLALNFYFSNQLLEANHKIAKFIQEKSILADQVQKVNNELLLNQEQLAYALDPGAIPVKIVSPDQNKQSETLVLWNPNKMSVFVATDLLPQLEEGNQYQLWALVNGHDAPTSVGVFDAASGLVQVRSIVRADKFAVTIEPIGGSETPTLEKLVLIGSVNRT